MTYFFLCSLKTKFKSFSIYIFHKNNNKITINIHYSAQNCHIYYINDFLYSFQFFYFFYFPLYSYDSVFFFLSFFIIIIWSWKPTLLYIHCILHDMILINTLKYMLSHYVVSVCIQLSALYKTQQVKSDSMMEMCG